MQAINVKERLKLAREKCPGMPEEVYLFADSLSEQMNEALVPTGVAMAIALALDEFRCERVKRHEGPDAPATDGREIIRSARYVLQVIDAVTDKEFADEVRELCAKAFNWRPVRRADVSLETNLALGGGIDLILTKSISRFARNTVDTLSTVRQLKEAGVEVIFEKENLRTFDPKCEVMLTIMSSLAQEESRSISENVRWGQQKSMKDGKVHIAYSAFLGYRKGPDGRPEIVEEEAKIVREIYDMFLSGIDKFVVQPYIRRKVGRSVQPLDDRTYAKHILHKMHHMSQYKELNDYVTIWKMMKRLALRAKVEPAKVFPHNLRHLFARTYYKVYKDIVGRHTCLL